MAVSGGATSAYFCWVEANHLMVRSTTHLARLCTPLEEAVPRMARGETVVVAGSDMTQLRALVRAEGVRA